MPSASAFAPLVTRERLVVAGLLVFTLVVRSGVLWAMRGNLQQDPDAYREIAENVLAHGVYGLGKDGPPTPTAYRPPLYPIVLSNLPAADGKRVSLFKVRVLHVLLGVGTVWLTYLTARRMLRAPFPLGEGGERSPPGEGGFLAALLAGLLVACDPILLNQQALVMTETLAALLAVLALWCLARYSTHRYWWNAGLAGGVIGLAALCRPTFLPWLGLVALGMLISDFRFQISDWKAKLSRNIANVAALAVIAAAVMSPWVIRNQREMGKPILTTTHGGYTLLLGNNTGFFKWQAIDRSGVPWVLDVQGEGRWWELLVLPVPSMSRFPNAPEEIRYDTLCYQEATNQIQGNPQAFLLASLYRIRQLWSPMPHKLTADESNGRRLLRYATAVWYCGVYSLAAVGVWRLRWKLLRSPWVWGVLLCLTFTAVHTLYWCNLRMRAPLMPFVALVASVAIPTRSVSEESATKRDSSLADASG